MHNGNGNGNGNGKRWVLIGLLVLGGFWLINDAYDDGFRDASVQSGQTSGMRRYHDGPDFPWGLVILGGIGYVAWRKGAFDRFGGPGGPFNGGHGHGQRGIQHYGSGANPSGQGFNPGSGARAPSLMSGTGRRMKRQHGLSTPRLRLPRLRPHLRPVTRIRHLPPALPGVGSTRFRRPRHRRPSIGHRWEWFRDGR